VQAVQAPPEDILFSMSALVEVSVALRATFLLSVPLGLLRLPHPLCHVRQAFLERSMQPLSSCVAAVTSRAAYQRRASAIAPRCG
jgi:hypothetical protein